MSATTAIAVLALSNSPLLAQDTGTAAPAPVATEPAPTPVTAAPEPAPETAPVTTDSTATSTPVESSETAAPVKKKTAVKATKAAAPTPAPRPIAHAATAVPAASAAPVLASPTAAPVKPAPVVDMNAAPAEPAPQATAAAKPANKLDDTTMMVGGGALALLALGGGAFALARRKDDDEAFVEEEIVHDEPVRSEMPTPRHDPVIAQEPAIVAPAASAFAWDNATRREEHRADESWYDRAMRGPTPDNPSLSLRKRLKRAAFFDKREREVAAGTAQRVDTDAGLPENVDTHELELA